MKKTVAILLTMLLLLSAFTSCYHSEQPEKELSEHVALNASTENKTDDSQKENEPEEEDQSVENESETSNEEYSDVWENVKWYQGSYSIPSENDGHFVSLWPDELPDGDRAENLSHNKKSTSAAWLRALFLFDFPDPDDYFDCMTQRTYVGAIDTIYFVYHNSDENHYDKSVTAEEFKEYIDAVKAVGYDENSVETETSYYCEKFGVSVSIVLGNEFPWADDDYRLRADKSQFTDCHIRVQLIDPDYAFDLVAIKNEEFKRWHEMQKEE